MNSGILLWKGRGLDIKNDLLPRVKPITQFLRGNAQHELKDELKTRLIATVRVHVERATARTKKKTNNTPVKISIIYVTQLK